MIITVSGKAGAGKSTIARNLARTFNLKHYSTGDFMREIASKRGISLIKLSALAEKDSTIDKELDERQIRLGKQEDNFVIDGRLSAYFIPNADCKVFLDADISIRAERILKDKREDETTESLASMIALISEREESEKKRYNEYYGIDYSNPEFYDIIIDTSKLEIDEVVSRITGLIKKGK